MAGSDQGNQGDARRLRRLTGLDHLFTCCI
jgi:hypothetical protein